MVEDIVTGVGLVLSWQTILAVCFGVFVGGVLGAIPGLTGTLGIALLLPVTFHMDPWVAIPMLLAVTKSSNFASNIPAMILRTPGVSSAAAIVEDGNALFKKGEGTRALKVSLYAGLLGDTFSDIVLIVSAGSLAAVALAFGPPEFAALIIFALTAVGFVASDNLLRGFVAASVGVFLGTVGLDPFRGVERFTFGTPELYSGFELMVLLIGFLAVPEIVKAAKQRSTNLFPDSDVGQSDPAPGKGAWARVWEARGATARGSVIGTVLGIIPGLGATVAAFVAYGEARRKSRTPHIFGRGSWEGIAAPEAANNATNGANMIPLLALGIPGDVVAAVLLGAFVLQGLAPGPLLFAENAQFVYAVYAGLLLSQVAALVFGLGFIRVAMLITKVSPKYLFSFLCITIVLGTYFVRNSLFDVGIMIAAGVLAYIMGRLGYSPVAMLIGFILGPMLERFVGQILTGPRGSLLVLFERPLSLGIVLLTVFILFGIYRTIRRSRALMTEEAGQAEPPRSGEG